MSRGVQTGTDVELVLVLDVVLPVGRVVVEALALVEDVVPWEDVLALPPGDGSEPQLAAMPTARVAIPRPPSFRLGWTRIEKSARRMGPRFAK
jgi:hypothetical protein